MDTKDTQNRVISQTRLRGTARRLAVDIFAEVRSGWMYASEIIATTFRKHPKLGGQDRRRIAETVYGLIRHHLRLSAIVDELVRTAGRGRGRVGNCHHTRGMG